MEFCPLRTKLLFLQLLLVLILAVTCKGQSEIEAENKIYSRILNQEVEYAVQLPGGYNKSDSINYPVVYLLHGINGDHTSWLARSQINILIDSLTRTGDIHQFIYIMPSAYNSYYINNYDSTFRYMDFFTQEFVPAIDSLYKTIPDKENRALLGLSMGGFGSIILGLKHADMFGSVISLSAAVRTEEIFISLPQTKYNNYFGKVFGFDLVSDDRITDHWKHNSPYFISDTSVLSMASKQNWYINCGLDDFLLPANESFHRWLTENRIPHEYHIVPGEHNWAHWRRATINGLIYLDQKIYRVNEP